MRSKKAAEVAELTTVHTSWNVRYGMFSDDLLITNNSPFTLTHVSVRASVVPNKKAWVQDVTADLIKPGETHEWKKVFSVPGSKVDESQSKVLLVCDQGESK